MTGTRLNSLYGKSARSLSIEDLEAPTAKLYKKVPRQLDQPQHSASTNQHPISNYAQASSISHVDFWTSRQQGEQITRSTTPASPRTFSILLSIPRFKMETRLAYTKFTDPSNSPPSLLLTLLARSITQPPIRFWSSASVHHRSVHSCASGESL
jgi:hypothetical protein